MHVNTKISLSFCALILASCSSNPVRYLPDGAGVAAPVRIGARTIELRDVVLPAYGSETAILAEGADGGLKALSGVTWADSSAEGITAELARRLDLRTTAAVASEPWPLTDPADLRLEVRIARMIAGAAGDFRLEGQFAVAAPAGQRREFLERFAISVPLADQSAAAIARSWGQALDQLAGQIAQRLAR